MSNMQASNPANLSLSGKTYNLPTVTNIISLVANTEITIALPANTSKFLIKARGLSEVKLSYTAGETSSNFITLYPGYEYQEKDIGTLNTVLYVQTSKNNETLEILSWV